MYLEILRKPISDFLDGKEISSLTFVAETLSSLVSMDSGRKFVISAVTENVYSNIVSDVVSLVINCLKRKVDGNQFEPIDSFVFFLRQLYSNFDGFEILKSQNLHLELVTSLNTITSDKWRLVIVDNLLNFSGTPKGVMLLHESGLMNECVQHLSDRYRRKLQVSRFERFGYGTLVSELSVTQPGMIALIKSGIVSSYLKELRSVIDKEWPFGQPHLAKDDYAICKLVDSILKSIFSFEALSIVIHLERQETPKDSFIGLMNELILIDEPGKKEELDDYYESHNVKFRLL
jgi:hypothetical protein